jgi:hypothetical protein
MSSDYEWHPSTGEPFLQSVADRNGASHAGLGEAGDPFHGIQSTNYPSVLDVRTPANITGLGGPWFLIRSEGYLDLWLLQDRCGHRGAR